MKKSFLLELEVYYHLNSDAYARFIISGATLANPEILGSIEINKAKGSMVDIYHEGFHAFTQLFLSPADKKALWMAYTERSYKSFKA